MNTGDYANDSFIGRTPRPTDPRIKEEVKGLARRAQNLEDHELKANPNDINALIAVESRGLNSPYTRES